MVDDLVLNSMENGMEFSRVEKLRERYSAVYSVWTSLGPYSGPQLWAPYWVHLLESPEMS